jgi:hypothetical protein
LAHLRLQQAQHQQHQHQPSHRSVQLLAHQQQGSPAHLPQPQQLQLALGLVLLPAPRQSPLVMQQVAQHPQQPRHPLVALALLFPERHHQQQAGSTLAAARQPQQQLPHQVQRRLLVLGSHLAAAHLLLQVVRRLRPQLLVGSCLAAVRLPLLHPRQRPALVGSSSGPRPAQLQRQARPLLVCLLSALLPQAQEGLVARALACSSVHRTQHLQLALHLARLQQQAAGLLGLVCLLSAPASRQQLGSHLGQAAAAVRQQHRQQQHLRPRFQVVASALVQLLLLPLERLRRSSLLLALRQQHRQPLQPTSLEHMQLPLVARQAAPALQHPSDLGLAHPAATLPLHLAQRRQHPQPSPLSVGLDSSSCRGQAVEGQSGLASLAEAAGAVHLASQLQIVVQRLLLLQQHLHSARELRPLGRPRGACSLGSHSSSRMRRLPLEVGLGSPSSSNSSSSRLRACSRSLTVRLCSRSAATSPANGREAGRFSRLAGTSRTAMQMPADVSSAQLCAVVSVFFIAAASALPVKLCGVCSEPCWLFTCAMSPK